MKKRSIELVLPPREPHFVGDGFRVHNFIPGGNQISMFRMDPFIMLDYNSKYYFPPSEKARGVSVHPHRGFETVTIAYKGKIAHHDSSGGGGVICEGDVQWMTAASGILHKEYHEENFSREGGEFQMVQLWVNLPAKYKMTKPKYQAISHKDIATYTLPGEAGRVEIIAGEFMGVEGTASTFTPVHLYNVFLQKGGKTEFSLPSHYNTGLLVVEGSIQINSDVVVNSDHFALLKNDGESFLIEAEKNAIVLIISGEPIKEPIVAHGPFVMNTRQEISEAIQDYNMGKFGYLEDH